MFQIFDTLLLLERGRLRCEWRRKVQRQCDLTIFRIRVPSTILDLNRHKCSTAFGETAAPVYQISAKSDNQRLSYWWFNKFLRPVFLRGGGKFPTLGFSKLGTTELSNLKKTYTNHCRSQRRFFLNFRYVARFEIRAP